MTRLRKPRLFVQVRKTSGWSPLQYIDERGGWWYWCGAWMTHTSRIDTYLADLLRTHVEVPL